METEKPFKDTDFQVAEIIMCKCRISDECFLGPFSKPVFDICSSMSDVALSGEVGSVNPVTAAPH